MSDALRRIRLTPDHVARVELPVDAPLHNPDWTLLDDDELDELARCLTRNRRRPIPIFAYGSLIWNPGFPVAATRRAVALSWHRAFNISLDQFRGSPDQPGLMLALAPGGTCKGVLLEIAEADEAEAMRALLKRELVARELSANAAWIEVQTEDGRQEALTFYAGPVGCEVVELGIDEQAHRLAFANGAAGSGAGYLLKTAIGLEEHGIHDDYVWTLQERVAQIIDDRLG